MVESQTYLPTESLADFFWKMEFSAFTVTGVRNQFAKHPMPFFSQLFNRISGRFSVRTPLKIFDPFVFLASDQSALKPKKNTVCM
jgi:hypothetical protein